MIVRRGLLSVVLLAATAGLGCRSSAPPPPAPPPTPLELADQLFERGDLVGAAAAYAGYLESAESPVLGGDRSLFRLAVIEFERGPRGTPGGLRLLRRLVAEYPSSPYSSSAELVLAYEAEARRLREQIEALKAIDLDPPSR